MPTKICNKCKLTKSTKEFHKSNRTLDGFRRECKDCRRVERKRTYADFKSRLQYYVYSHTSLTTGEVFYIGSGCSNRAYDTHKRTDLWYSVVKEVGEFKVDILIAHLTKREAIDKEQELQLKLKPRANARLAGKGVRWGILNGKSKSIVNCRGEVFETVTDASIKYHRSTSNISRACKGAIKYSGKYEDGKPIKWKYLENKVEV